MRGDIGFDGLIMSDDLSMKALKGPFDERAAAVIEAGLDVVLHCNGDLEEARAVASAAPVLAGALAASSQCRARGDRPASSASMWSGPSGSWPRSRQNWASPERAPGLAAPRRAARVRFCTRRWPAFVYWRAAC